ncbi:MAG: hypothetical protein AABX59_00120 [Nanoarchaeota archaeon]
MKNQDLEGRLREAARNWIFNLPLEYKVTIVGAGKVAYSAVNRLCGMPRVGGINVVNRTLESAERIRKSFPHKVSIYPLENLEEALKGTHISIIAVGNMKLAKSEGRQAEFDYNIPIIKNIAKAHKDFQGATIVVSNPTDHLAHVFAGEAHGDMYIPYRVVGLNHLDMIRGRKLLCGLLSMHYGKDLQVDPEDITFLIAGIHSKGGIIPLLSHTKLFGKMMIDVIADRTNIPQDKIAREIGDWPFEIIKEYGDTSQETGEAIGEVVEAIVKGNSVVEVSTYIPRKNIEAFIGWPVRFNGFETSPLEILPENMTDQERYRLNEVYLALRGELNRMDVGRVRAKRERKFQGEDNRPQELFEMVVEKVREGDVNKIRELEAFIHGREDIIEEMKGIFSREIKQVTDLDSEYANLIMQASQNGKIWYGYKVRRFVEGHDEWPNRDLSFTQTSSSGGFHVPDVDRTYKMVVYSDKPINKNPRYFLWTLFRKVDPDNFSAIFHTNYEPFVSKRCSDIRECYNGRRCDRPRTHVNEWCEGIAPEIYDLIQEKIKV